jgi:tRNA (guanine37-N1)-methyltransferase
MRFDVLSIFPQMFDAYLKEGIVGRAIERGILDVRLLHLRDFAEGPHRTTDDRPYGGGAGMVMKPEPIYRALETVDRLPGGSQVILLSPQGKLFTQRAAWELSELEQIILICGRYEGVDERIRVRWVDRELSIGDYVLSGGELAALVVIDAVSRLIPGVLGGERSNQEDSFAEGLLEYPHYTRPRVFQGVGVPDVLLSGDHEKIRVWRRRESLMKTVRERADLLEKAELTPEDRAMLKELREE